MWIWVCGLLVAALILAILECFIPSGGIIATLSLLAITASVGVALSTQSVAGFIYFLTIIIVVPILLRAAIIIFPHTFLGRRLLLNPESDPALVPDEHLQELRQLLGRRGMAISRMMPCGLVEIKGKHWDAVSDSGPIDPATEIIAVRLDGTNLIVRTFVQEKSPAHNKDNNAAKKNSREPVIDDPFA